jgi:regulator of protease activity HflC (stomatin/prohibitin superfamily)
VAKSKEGFVFNIDLQVQIHVADKLAPKVISMVGTMQNLVNEVLQAVVGNYFRDTLQGMAAVEFIENRAAVQAKAQTYIAEQIRRYNVETRGVYIQDVVLPVDIVTVLTQREIANQEKATFTAQKEAQLNRIAMEKQAGLADRQRDLAGSEVEIAIKENRARARKAEADGEATYIEQTGRAKGAEIEAVGLARARGFEAQKEALGPETTAMINMISELVKSPSRFVPDIVVNGNGGSGDTLSAGIMGFLREFERRRE